MDRKKFLKWFGIGVVAAPFAGKAVADALSKMSTTTVNPVTAVATNFTTDYYSPEKMATIIQKHGENGMKRFELLKSMGFDIEKEIEAMNIELNNRFHGTTANQEGP